MTEKDLRTILSQNIRRFRGYRKLSQADFAEKIDISIPFLSDIENGKKWVSPHTLIKIADTLDIDAYVLIKPETIIPDNAVNLLEKYTDEVYKDFGYLLDNMLKVYLHKLKTDRKNTLS